MKLLAVLVGAAARTGGPPAFVGESAYQLEQAGHSVAILATDLALAPTGWVQRQRRVTADELHASLRISDTRVFPARFPRRLAYSPALARAARELAADSDVVHLHNLWQFPQYAGHQAAIRAGVPYVVSPHGGLDPFLRRHGRVRKAISMALFQREILERAALIHVTTAAEAKLIADVAPRVPRAVVPCGVHADEFRAPAAQGAFRRAHLDAYEGPVVLFLGRLTYKKGIDVLVRAFAHVRRRLDCRLAVVGPDDEGLRGRLEGLAAEAGVGAAVVFVGPLFGEERRAALADADVWALSSYTENFGIAVVEAMAAGCAVCISPAVNLADEVSAAGAGVVAGLDPEAFGSALTELLADPARRAELGRRAREFSERYDWNAVTPQLIEMYRRISDRRRRGAPARRARRRDPR